MKKTIILKHPVSDLRAFLRITDADEIIGGRPTSPVAGTTSSSTHSAQASAFAGTSTRSMYATIPLRNATA